MNSSLAVTVDMPAPFDTRELRNALGRFTTGVAVVTTTANCGKAEGLTINSFTSVSLDPPLVLWSLRRDAPSHPMFLSSGRFVVNILGAHQLALSKHFATPRRNKFAGIDSFVAGNGCPRFQETIAHFECDTVEVVQGGDHSIFIGRVTSFAHREGDPLVYSGGSYHRIAQSSIN